MFKNICKNIKTYKFSYAKNIEILVQFFKKILRTLKVLKFQKPKNIGSLTWILKIECNLTKCEYWLWAELKVFLNPEDYTPPAL